MRAIVLFVGAALFAGTALFQSFFSIENGERGVVERYGRPVRDLLPGLHVKLPFGMERVRRVPAPERLLPMPIGYRLIDEKLGRSPLGPEKEWLTGDNNIVEIKASVLYSIRNPRDYLYRVANVTDLDPRSIEPRSPDFTIRRIAEAALTQIIGGMEVTEVIASGAESIAVEAKKHIQRDVDALGLGVEIVRFQLLSAGPLASVKQAFREVQDAKAERDQMRNVAETAAGQVLSNARRKEVKTLQKAETTAERLVLDARSQAELFVAQHEALGDVNSPAAIARRMALVQELFGLVKPEFISASKQQPAVFYTER